MVKVNAEDLEWILTMPGWEFNTVAVKRTSEVKDRLWEALGVRDVREQFNRTVIKRKENNR